MENLIKYYPEVKFGGFTDIDGTIKFYNRVNALIKKEYTILDVGCGRGAYGEDNCEYRRNLRILKGKCQKVIGIDLDPEINNPYIDEYVQIYSDNNWKIEENSIDLIVCDSVMEHIKTPKVLFENISRVLKPGGFFCARTVNKYGYISTFSRIIPERFHKKILSKLQSKRKEEDIFEAHYRLNTKKSIKKYLEMNNFNFCIISHEPEPAYFKGNLMFLLFNIYRVISPKAINNIFLIFGKFNKR